MLNVELLVPLMVVIALAAGVLLKKLQAGEGSLKRKSGRFLGD